MMKSLLDLLFWRRRRKELKNRPWLSSITWNDIREWNARKLPAGKRGKKPTVP
ncbi:MAG TPA: hypothetical protein VJA40_04305 [archaeon]|nr:hypothetical protein [archaeon]